MATLDAEDLSSIRTIVQEELNANINIQRLDVSISSIPTLNIQEHDKLMSLENTSVTELTNVSRTAIALAAVNRRKR